MKRQPLSIDVVAQLEFIHGFAASIAPPLANAVKWKVKNKKALPTDGVYPSFSLGSSLTTQDLEQSLLTSPFVQRVLEMPRADQGGLQVIFVAGAGDAALIQYADKLSEEDNILAVHSFAPQIKKSHELGFDLEGLEDTFDVRGFQVGISTPVVLFSIKKSFSKLNAKEYHLLGFLLEKYWRGNETLQGLTSLESKEIEILRLAVAICDNHFSSIVPKNVAQTVENLTDLIDRLEARGVVLKGLGVDDIKSALKLAVTMASQEIMQNSADYIKQELTKCKSEIPLDNTLKVAGSLESLTLMQDPSVLWTIIKEMQKFLLEVKDPSGIWAVFYTSSTAEFKNTLEQFQTCLALYAFNTKLQENRDNGRTYRVPSGNVTIVKKDDDIEMSDSNPVDNNANILDANNNNLSMI